MLCSLLTRSQRGKGDLAFLLVCNHEHDGVVKLLLIKIVKMSLIRCDFTEGRNFLLISP